MRCNAKRVKPMVNLERDIYRGAVGHQRPHTPAVSRPLKAWCFSGGPVLTPHTIDTLPELG